MPALVLNDGRRCLGPLLGGLASIGSTILIFSFPALGRTSSRRGITSTTTIVSTSSHIALSGNPSWGSTTTTVGTLAIATILNKIC